MPHRIEVGYIEGIRDPLGEKIGRRIVEHLGIPVDGVTTIEVFTLDGHFSPAELESIAKNAFADPVSQLYTVDAPLASGFHWLIEVGFRPGVTDNVGRTAREALALLLGKKYSDTPAVYTSRQYLIKGAIVRNQAEEIAVGLLANELIERYEIVSPDEFPASGIPARIPRVIGVDRPVVEEIDLSLGDAELNRLSSSRVLALNLAEMKAIRDYLSSKTVLAARKKVGLGKKITDAELEALAQTWSEHCKHKIFNSIIHYTDESGNVTTIDSLFTTYIKRATNLIRKEKGKDDWCLSVFEDNAGIIKFNDDWNVVFKVETHNSPSALDPYGGALTGIVGVNRDPFGTGIGARLIFNTDVFCFAPPDHEEKLPRRILHPRRIFEGVREGVEHGGNKSGIPTVNGCLVFDERYLGKPLVYCGTGGFMPARIGGKETHVKKIIPGDLIVMTGGRIGKDGIHGATFSSEELHEESPVTAVQIGDPITQKKMTDFLLIARDRGLYRAITDNGAGGLSSSIGETAKLSGGCLVNLEEAPLKYSGLNPWEILLSESQERMTLAVPPENSDAFLTLASQMDVEATVIGQYTDSGYFHILYEGKTVAYIDLEFLHDGLPRLELYARFTPPLSEEPDFPEPADLGEALKALLSRLNICSKESIVRQYDHEVQGGSVVKPLVGVENDGPSDGAVLRPLLDSCEGLVVACGICPRLSDLDAYHMAACALDEAIRNNIAVGGSLAHMACLDNFCWCDPVQSEKTPDGHYKLAQLVRANMALFDYTTAFGVPCISGKDSMKNDYQIGGIKISIPPTLLFSTLSKIDDVRKCVTMDLKAPGHLVYVLGETLPELGGSEWYAQNGCLGSQVPRVNAPRAKLLYEALSRAIDRGLVASCHDCADGGLGVALAESAFAGGWGMSIHLREVPCRNIERNDHLLFSESPSRFVVTIPPEAKGAFEDLMLGLPAGLVGKVIPEKILEVYGLDDKLVIGEDISGLKKAWQGPLGV